MTDMIGQRRLRRAFLGLCTAVGALAAANAAAQPAPSFDQLFGQSAEAPRTQIIEADIARAEGLAEQARVRPNPTEIGRASCRERVCQYVYISVGAVSLTKKKQ